MSYTERILLLLKTRGELPIQRLAEVIKQAEGCWLLYEHQCPICAATQQCQRFCCSELALFSALLGADAEVSRTEHLLHGVFPLSGGPYVDPQGY